MVGIRPKSARALCQCAPTHAFQFFPRWIIRQHVAELVAEELSGKTDDLVHPLEFCHINQIVADLVDRYVKNTFSPGNDGIDVGMRPQNVGTVDIPVRGPGTDHYQMIRIEFADIIVNIFQIDRRNVPALRFIADVIELEIGIIAATFHDLPYFFKQFRTWLDVFGRFPAFDPPHES